MFFKLNLVESTSLTGILDRFKTIPIGTTRLDLTWNKLNRLSKGELNQVCAAIPVTVTSLNLGWNELDGGLAQALLAIKAPLTSLVLAGNNFHELSVDELEQIMAALPVTLCSLDLGFNLLAEEKSGDEIARIVKAIPPGVTSLNLSANHLYLKNITELSEILRAIPKTVLSVNLGEDIFLNRTNNEKAVLLAVLMEVDPDRNRLSYDDSSGKSYNLSMQIIGGFMAGLGVAAVALAFTVLSGGILGLILGIAGVAGILAGVGLFAVGRYRTCQEEPADICFYACHDVPGS